VRARYHVVVLDPSGSAILLDRHASMWMLPTASDEDTIRGTDVIGRCLSACGVTGRIRWTESIGFEAAAAELQLLAVVDAAQASRCLTQASGCLTPALTPVPLAGINLHLAIIPAQAQALRVYRDTRESASDRDDSDYRTSGMWQALDTWLAATLKNAGSERRQYKAQVDDCVMAIPTPTGAVYFKGHAGSAFVEADLSHCLARYWPSHIASTIAYDSDRGWWLTAGAPGAGLTTGMTLRKALAVIDTLASMQADACKHVNDLRRIGCPDLDVDDIVRRLSTLLDTAWRHHRDAPVPGNHSALALPREMRHALEQRAQVSDALAAAAATLHRLQPPLTWLHTDLADSNIFVDDESDRVTFIDLANPFVGPAPIALYSFLHHLPRYVDRARLIEEDWTGELKRRYARIWSGRGWPHAGESFLAAKLMMYAMKTLKGLDSALARHANTRDGGDLLRRYMEERAAAILCQGVLAAVAARARSAA
jgi:hypothetical protein